MLLFEKRRALRSSMAALFPRKKYSMTLFNWKDNNKWRKLGPENLESNFLLHEMIESFYIKLQRATEEIAFVFRNALPKRWKSTTQAVGRIALSD